MEGSSASMSLRSGTRVQSTATRAPGPVIPIAKSTGIIVKITKAVLKRTISGRPYFQSQCQTFVENTANVNHTTNVSRRNG